MADKKRVLILCTGNSARSQMAEGLLREIAGDRFEDPPAPGAADPDSTMAVFRRVRDEIREWLRNDFIPAA